MNKETTKWALILGGSSGMGLAAARKLGKEGWNLLIVHRDRRSILEGINKAFDDIRHENDIAVHAFNFDATNSEKISLHLMAFAEVLSESKIDLMVHAVSRGNLKALVSDSQPQLSSEDLHFTLDAMSINVLVWIRLLVESKLMNNPGRLITLTSMGSSRYWPGYGAVAMAKASLELLTKYLAIELAPYGIRTACLQAGVTDTPSLRMIPENDKILALASENHPLGRITQAEDVANVIYLLSRAEADWINGSVIHVDGGEHLL